MLQTKVIFLEFKDDYNSIDKNILDRVWQVTESSLYFCIKLHLKSNNLAPPPYPGPAPLPEGVDEEEGAEEMPGAGAKMPGPMPPPMPGMPKNEPYHPPGMPPLMGPPGKNKNIIFSNFYIYSLIFPINNPNDTHFSSSPINHSK